MKKWLVGYLIDSGFKVEYEENDKIKSMEFPTESEAQIYFEEEKNGR